MMDKNEEILKIVINEINEKSLGTTCEFLKNHEVSINASGIPRIKLIDRSDNRVTRVYLELTDEDYYFVFKIEKGDGELRVIASYVEAKVRVYLCIYSNTFEPAEISKKLNLCSSKDIKKGNPVVPGAKRISPENRWYFEPQKDTPGTVEDKLEHLLLKLENAKKDVLAICNEEDTSACIHIVYEAYTEWMGGWHFNSKVLAKVAALNVEMDIDLYSS